MIKASEIKLFCEIDFNYRESVKVANGQLVDAVGKGTIQLKLANKSGKISNVKIEDRMFQN